MEKFESNQEPISKKSKEASDEIIAMLSKAIEDPDFTIEKMGDLFYETFKGDEYTADMVLPPIKQAYDGYNKFFEPKLDFYEFMQSFGSGLVKLCQQKLIENGYDLGHYGDLENGVDGKMGKKTRSA